MSKRLVEDGLWERVERVERVEPLLPAPKPRRFRYPGRQPLDDRAAVDSMTWRALRGGDQTGKTPTNRGRKGTKDHLLTDGRRPPAGAAHATATARHEPTRL